MYGTDPKEIYSKEDARSNDNMPRYDTSPSF
jgi:hypothetical protein